MKVVLMLSLLLIMSCGRKVQRIIEHNETSVENKYDDSRLNAYELIQDARLNAIDVRLDALNASIVLNANDNEVFHATIENDFVTTNAFLNNLQAEVTVNKVTVLTICASGENLIKMNNDFYAVYMVSNNFGTYLGKLADNVNYATTDNIHAGFHLNNGVIICR